MPRGYRHVILAALGFLILGNAHQQSDQPKADKQHKSADSTAQDITKRKDEHPKSYEAHCAKPADVNEAGVCAAIEQASAARAANNLSAAALWWNKIGVGAVLLTLAFTAWAARAAAKAAQIAHKSMELFQHAEGGFMVPRIDIPDFNTIHVRGVNRGRSLATIIYADLVFVPDEKFIQVPLRVSDEKFESGVGITPDSFYDFKPREIPWHEPDVYLFGGIMYQTMFGSVFFAPIGFRINRLTQEREVLETTKFKAWERACKPSKWPFRKKG